MHETFQPDSEAGLVDLIRWALAEKRTLEVRGHGTRAGFGNTGNAAHGVTTRALSGIVAYQPEELVMVARAGTPRAEVEAALAERGQHLPFEPPDLGPANGEAHGTVGGIFMSNLSGPRRFASGAARDYLLGLNAVNGRGEAWKCGGRVIKNVTGYDLSKLMAGSWGTLSIATELTFKVLPAAPTSASLAIHEPDARGALALLSRVAGGASGATGLAYLPGRVCRSPALRTILGGDTGRCVVRVEGSGKGVRQRLADLRRTIRGGAVVETLDDAPSRHLWRALRDLHPLADSPVVLRVRLPPFEARAIVAEWPGMRSNPWFADAAGGCLWVGADAGAAAALTAQLRRRVSANGSVVLFRAPEPVKREAGVFPPQPEALLALSRRVKQGFDPHRVLNPGRLAPD